MHQALRLAGEKLSQLLLTSATNLKRHDWPATTSACCYCNFAAVACVWWNLMWIQLPIFFIQVIIIFSSDWSAIIYHFFPLHTSLAWDCLHLKTHCNLPRNSTFILFTLMLNATWSNLLWKSSGEASISTAAKTQHTSCNISNLNTQGCISLCKTL